MSGSIAVPYLPGTAGSAAGVPVTSVVRTVVDLGERSGPEALGAVVDEALRRRLVGIGELHAMHAALTTAPGRWRAGTTVLAEVLRHRPLRYGAGDSAWELSMDQAWDRWGLPAAVRQYDIRTPGGRYRPDWAIVELRIAVDWNGYEYHGGRSRFDADSDRRADLSTAGWFPLDFTSRSSPERICRSVRSVVAQRSTLGSAGRSGRPSDE